MVSKRLRGDPILGADFMSKTGMVLDLANARLHFAFAPQKFIPLALSKEKVACFQTLPLLDSWSKVEHSYLGISVRLDIKVGELVFYKIHPISHAGKRIAAKLLPRYRGPFRIESFLTPVIAKLVDPVSGRFITRAHISLLKPGPFS